MKELTPLLVALALSGVAGLGACGSGAPASVEARPVDASINVPPPLSGPGDAGPGGDTSPANDATPQSGGDAASPLDAARDATHSSDATPPDGASDAPPAPNTGPALSPYLVGQNLWMIEDINALSLWPVVKASGVRLIRIGGAGPDSQPPSNDTYVSWVNQIRAIGAEPIVQVSRMSSAANAASVVKAINVTAGLGVKLWSIGNEPNLQSSNPVSVTAVGQYVRESATAMRDADPSIVILAPELAWFDQQYFPSLLGGADDITGTDAKGRFYIDAVTFHTYPFGATYGRSDVVGAAAALEKNVIALKGMLAACDKQHARGGTQALQWGLTEFNITYANPANNGPSDYGTESFINGQFFAEVFGVGMKQQALTMATWSVHEGGGNRGGSDLGFLDANNTPRSSYWHMQMLGDFEGSHAPSTSNIPLVKTVASAAAGSEAVMLLNEDMTAYAYSVGLSATTKLPPSALQVVASTAIDAHSEGTLPAQATRVLIFDATGKLKQQTDFSLGDYIAGKPPTVTKY